MSSLPGNLNLITVLRTLAIISTCACVALAACGGDDEEAAATEPAAATSESNGGRADAPSGNGSDAARKREGGASKPGITITSGESQFGEVLFDADERAIYLFDKESGSESECYGACAAAWPPVLTEGAPSADGAADTKLLGTSKRDDGTTQVTYAGQPLYYYVDDPPGQVLCHEVEEFGGLWLVLEPSGEAVG